MARFVYNLFIRILIYALPFWLRALELTVHRAMKEKEPDAFLALGLMLSAIALLILLCLRACRTGWRDDETIQRLRYRCDIGLIAVAAALAVIGVPHLVSDAWRFPYRWPDWPACVKSA